jgi:pimeloyl-[acyl-carrier protein] methyl ester esterase
MKKIHITREGKGIPLVLIHGWGFDSQIWQPVLPLLTHRYELHCVDLPGFGQTPFMEWEDFKEGLFSELPAEFALLGWSLGGMVATRIALEESHRVTHLINVASSPCFVEDGLWPGILEATLSEFALRLVTEPERVLQQFMALQLSGRKGSIVPSPTVKGLQMGLNWLLTWDFRKHLTTLKCPVLYVFGQRDLIVPKQTMAMMQNLYPNFHYFMLNKASHALFLSHPSDFAHLVENMTL